MIDWVYHGEPKLNVGFQEVVGQLHLLTGLKGGHAQIGASGAAEGVAEITLCI